MAAQSLELKPVLRIDWFSFFGGGLLVLQSLLVDESRVYYLLVAGVLVVGLGQLLQALEALRCSRLYGIVLKDDLLTCHGVPIALSEIRRFAFSRPGVELEMTDDTRVWIKRRVYRNSDLTELCGLLSRRGVPQAERID